ncbi:MAG TPA: hypothetical protein VLI06_06585, partial [Solimonas sp.]|nr:hypothetical protein [Solimonas sp.]
AWLVCARVAAQAQKKPAMHALFFRTLCLQQPDVQRNQEIKTGETSAPTLSPPAGRGRRELSRRVESSKIGEEPNKRVRI